MSTWMRTCVSCNYNNDSTAGRCNNCGRKFDKHGRDYFDRWQCSKCYNVNMRDNKYCVCGKSRPGCFITTLTCDILGKPDNCNIMEILRDFRANYLELTENGRLLLEKYQLYSIFLVPKIENDANKLYLAENIYSNYLMIVIELIKDKQFDIAINKYKDMVYFLLENYQYKE